MKIQISKGAPITDDNIYQHHLVTNHLNKPDGNIDKVIMYAERRHLMTLLTSGVRSGKYAFKGYLPSNEGKTVKTEIKQIPKGEMISSTAWKWKTMGRIQKASEVVGNAAVGSIIPGTSSMGGYFSLTLADNYLKPQMNTLFPNGNIARVISTPKTLGPKKFLYKFQTFANDTFDFATWFIGSNSRKTVFGGYSSVGERSRRGYANFHTPDSFIQHTTKQRKSFDLSGDALTENVYWYEAAGEKGFAFEGEVQSRAQFLLEDETKSWEGRSTMRDKYGNLLATPSQHDEKGDPIIAGDGFIPQIRGANDFEGSGSFGLWTYEDLEDMVRSLKKKGDYNPQDPKIAVTGTDGIAWLDIIATQRAKDLNVTINITGNGEGLELGYKFRKFTILGETVIFVENPQFDDDEKYPAKLATNSGSFGIKSSTVYFMDMSAGMDGRNNVEIRSRGRAGINRNMFYAWFNGFTGRKGAKPMNPVDAEEFHMMKETALAVYRTETNGILEPNLTMAA